MPQNKYILQNFELFKEFNFLSNNLCKSAIYCSLKSPFFYKIERLIFGLHYRLGIDWAANGFYYWSGAMHWFFVLNKSLELLSKYSYEDWLSYKESDLRRAVSEKINFLIIKGIRGSE